MHYSHIIEFDITAHTYQSLSVEQFSIAQEELNKIYWIHCDLTEEDFFSAIAQKLFLPDSIKKMCAEESTIPKANEDEQSLTIQIECLTQTELEEEISFGNLIFYLTSQYCFTASSSKIPAVDAFKENFQKNLRFAKTPCFIVFLILDNVINDFSKLLLDFENAADQIDIQTREIQNVIYNQVMAIKKQVMRVQHHIAGIRDILMRISGRMISVISDQCRLSLVSLLDHSQIIFNEAGAIRDILKNTLDQIDNALMQKMNKTMGVLTAFAAIFLPLSLIAGIYGMNFQWIPELNWKYGYFWALGLMLLCGLLLYIYFKKMKWW